MGESLMGFFPVEPGHIGGAIIKTEGHEPSKNGPLIYLNGGDDLNEVSNRITSAGGTVLQEKTAISEEHGYYALFLDTEGNRVALHSMQ
jgi:predicted enzyme related to lactoylglutathione lyase